jgi:hypothetical protein
MKAILKFILSLFKQPEENPLEKPPEKPQEKLKEGQVSPHFSRKEFECSCGCGFDTVDDRLVDALEKVREHFGKPMVMHCICRCWKKNKDVGGAEKSQHLYAHAGDFHIDGVDNKEIYDFIDKEVLPNTGGIGLYEWGVHMDIRHAKARWS